MTKLTIGKKNYNIGSLTKIGEGGEAIVYQVDAGTVLKVFRSPDDSTFTTPIAQHAAQKRLQEHQRKLPLFPKSVPDTVISPIELARDGNNIVGYTMRYVNDAERLMMYSDRQFRQGIDPNLVSARFLSMHKTVKALHNAHVVIGDFNEFNVLIPHDEKKEPMFIDIDSAQFGGFACRLYTVRFVDPKLCEFNGQLQLVGDYSPESDWFAFDALLFQSCLFTGPYSGIHRPKDVKKKVSNQGQRIFERITVFDPEVIYPKPAMPMQCLPDELLHRFHQVFEKDDRHEFPARILENMRWTNCQSCGCVHARVQCPECAHVAPGLVKQTIEIHGVVTSKTFFTTKGKILFMGVQNSHPQYLYWENGRFFRENATHLMDGAVDPKVRYRFCGDKTLLARDNMIVVLGGETEQLSVDKFENRFPVFDANSHHYYWLQGGKLQKNGQFGPDHIGNVLTGNTQFWVGEEFGFGFYRMGQGTVGFMFDANKHLFNDNTELMPIKGQLLDSLALFAGSLCWFIYSVQDGSVTRHYCQVLDKNGKLIASESAEKDSDHWLGNLRGKFALGRGLLSATDDGIIRVVVTAGRIAVETSYPDTAPFVDANVGLFGNRDGLLVSKANAISLLQIKQ